MTDKSFRFLGTILSDGKAVPGLSVRVWNQGDKRTRKPVREFVTDVSGSFVGNLKLPEKTLSRAGRGSLRVSIHDVSGEAIWNSPRALSIRTERDLSRTIKLDASVVKEHLDELRLPRKELGLLPRNRVDDLRQVLSKLRGSPERESIARRAMLYGVNGICPGPDFAVIDTLVQDAWRVLDGDPRGPLDFVEKLELVHFQSLGREPKTGVRLRDDRQATLPASRSFIGSVRRFDARCVECAPQAGAGDAPTAAKLGGRGEDLIGNGFLNDDAALALFMAAKESGYALGLGEGREVAIATAELQLGRVVEILCLFAGIEPIFQLAIDGLRWGAPRLDRFGDITDLIGWECGPDDGPVRVPPWPRPWECLEIFVPPLCLHTPYCSFQISEVSPSQACPGALITIRGNNFGDDTGSVCFRSAADSDFDLFGQILSWSDETIVVQVPAGATCGVQVKPLPRSKCVCGRLMTVTPFGFASDLFLGGAAGVTSFTVDGRRGSEICVPPGQMATVAWETCAADTVDLEIIDSAGNVVWSQSNAPASGSWAWSVPATNVSLQYTARITVEGDCAPAITTRSSTIWVEEQATLGIQGMEVTQAIQYYRSAQHLTDPNDRGQDNSAQLAVGKAAWVRVYVRSGLPPGFNGGQLDNVSGVLEVYRTTGGVESLVTTLTPQAPGVVTAQANPVYAVERGTIGATLNFVIPATEMTGRLRLRALLSSPHQHCATSPAEYSETVDVDLNQTLQVAAVLVSYNGVDGAGNPLNLAAPTLAQVSTALGWSLAVMPVHTQNSLNAVRSAGTTNLTVPLNDARSCPGCCSPNWITLAGQVANVATNDGNQANWVYYGFVPGGVPLNVGGCRANGVASGPITNQTTTAHEITHDLGRPHAPCGNVGNFDTGYPAYEPYDGPAATAATNPPGATLGEYGLDIRNGTIRPPTDNDYMSYCTPRWISMRNHQMLQSPPGLVSATIPVGFGAGAMEESGVAERFIQVIGVITEDDEVVLYSVRRVESHKPAVGPVVPGAQIALLDDNGNKVTWARLHRPARHLDSNSCAGGDCYDDDTPLEFIATIPDADGATLEFRRGKETRCLREAPKRKPRISSASGRILRNGKLRLRWRQRSYGEEADVWVRYSTDRGKNWRGLAVGLTGPEATLDVSHIPPGDVILELSLHDGFYVDRTTVRRVTIPPHAPEVGIIHPEDTVEPGTLMLWGVARGCDGNEVAADDCRWLLDGKEVARGAQAFLPTPRAGKHKVTFVAKDGHGESRTSREVTVVRK